jgi:hypothetical protein
MHCCVDKIQGLVTIMQNYVVSKLYMVIASVMLCWAYLHIVTLLNYSVQFFYIFVQLHFLGFEISYYVEAIWDSICFVFSYMNVMQKVTTSICHSHDNRKEMQESHCRSSTCFMLFSVWCILGSFFFYPYWNCKNAGIVTAKWLACITVLHEKANKQLQKKCIVTGQYSTE